MELKEGIILKTNKYLENSKILYISTSNGLISLLSRASLNQKSKNYSYSHELTLIKFQNTQSKKNSFDIITCGEIVNNYSNIKLNYNKMIYVTKILESSLKMSIYIDNYSVFYEFLKQILDKINESNNTEIVKIYNFIFHLKLLYLLGIGPNFKKCSCGKNNQIIGFSIDSGCLKCSECDKDYKNIYNIEIIQLINILYLAKINTLNDEILEKFVIYIEQFNDFTTKYYEQHLSYVSTTEKIIKKIEN